MPILSLKINKRRHPNNSVGMGKMFKINKCRAYAYSELMSTLVEKNQWDRIKREGGHVSFNISGTTGKSETNDTSFESPCMWLLESEKKLNIASLKVPWPLK